MSTTTTTTTLPPNVFKDDVTGELVTANELKRRQKKRQKGEVIKRVVTFHVNLMDISDIEDEMEEIGGDPSLWDGGNEINVSVNIRIPENFNPRTEEANGILLLQFREFFKEIEYENDNPWRVRCIDFHKYVNNKGQDDIAFDFDPSTNSYVIINADSVEEI